MARGCRQEDLAQLEVENVVKGEEKFIQSFPVYGIFDVIRLYCVDCGLNDCPGALGGKEVVQELEQCHRF